MVIIYTFLEKIFFYHEGGLFFKERDQHPFSLSLGELKKCSMMVRFRHHATTTRKERVELSLGFRENRETWGGIEGENDTKLIKVLGLIMRYNVQ